MSASPLCKVNVAIRNQSHLLLWSIACTTKEDCVNYTLYLNMPSILVPASLASHYVLTITITFQKHSVANHRRTKEQDWQRE